MYGQKRCCAYYVELITVVSTLFTECQTFCRILSKYDQFNFSGKNNLAQPIGPIVLHTNAKNWEDPQSRVGEKAKKHHTKGLTDGMTDKRTGVNL